MHPLIARIHPALRTALWAWFLSRCALWLIAPGRLLHFETGTPVVGLVSTATEHLRSTASSPVADALLAAAPWVIVEVAILLAALSVYRFARRTELPQVAERACWLWLFNPLLILNAADWGTQMAAATGTMAVAALVTHRPRLAAAAAIIAVGCRLEFILLWPAIAVASWVHLRDKESMVPLVLGVVTVPLAFTAWIAASWHLAGATNTSLRAMHGDSAWRQWTSMSLDFPQEWLMMVGLAAALVLTAAYFRRFPRWYALCAVPAIGWPMLQTPATFAAVTAVWAVPAYVYLAVSCDDRRVERAVMAALIIAFCLVLLGT